MMEMTRHPDTSVTFKQLTLHKIPKASHVRNQSEVGTTGVPAMTDRCTEVCMCATVSVDMASMDGVSNFVL
jgi:hypothetical protein